ncbi:MAG: 5-(carboxyamino)imidazole ribonucleotide mutase [Bacillota bacterium]|nr:5-(carboxyamino)imidazole ribonucleotide mutase [Bacillota bacterium]NLJ03581.1 5-(carboxyamino)imidazole ribonucleotide mutase [Bacillota bacterium]
MEVRVGVVMGSASDWKTMKRTCSVLDELGIAYEKQVISGHRTPDLAFQYAREAKQRGLKVIIAGAGLAAHLAGILAANTTLPVLGVPMQGGPFSGLDALLSTVQMPGGIPVASLAVGDAGAANAGWFAAAILALSDEELAQRLAEERKKMAQRVQESNAMLDEE